MKELLIRATTGMNHQNIILSQGGQVKKTAYCVWLYLCGVCQKGKFRDTDQQLSRAGGESRN